MGFPQGPARGSSTVRVRAPVFAIGRRAFVVCPGGRRARVTLTDLAGADSPLSLAADTEVDIVAWRPHGPGDTRYRVRSASDGVEGWLASGNLRIAQAAVAPPTVPERQIRALPRPAPAGAGRRGETLQDARGVRSRGDRKASR